MSEIRFIELEDKLRAHFNYGEDVYFHPILSYVWNQDIGEWKWNFIGFKIGIGLFSAHLTTIYINKKEFEKIIGLKNIDFYSYKLFDFKPSRRRLYIRW